jgi:urea carboxylase-associated protein 2
VYSLQLAHSELTIFGGQCCPTERFEEDKLADNILFEEVLQPGSAWTHILKRGTALRLTDLEGSANVGAIFYNSDCPVERLNIPDTLKAQHIARLTKGFVLYSDMGRILASITDDSLGWHDPLSGCLNSEAVAAKYGAKTYQESRNDFYKNAHDSFLIELAKQGLSSRDLCPNINFFSKVTVDNEGALRFHSGHSAPGSFVELRAEMNTLIILSSCPHPLDPEPAYSPKPVRISVRSTDPPATDDICRISRKENERGFILTERYYL